MVGKEGMYNYSLNAYFQTLLIAVDMLDDGALYPVQLPIVFFYGLKGTVRDQYMGQNNLRPTQSLINIATIQKRRGWAYGVMPIFYPVNLYHSGTSQIFWLLAVLDFVNRICTPYCAINFSISRDKRWRS